MACLPRTGAVLLGGEEDGRVARHECHRERHVVVLREQLLAVAVALWHTAQLTAVRRNSPHGECGRSTDMPHHYV
eukprot:1192676-Prorocentrum_minimum.AAC.1